MSEEAVQQEDDAKKDKIAHFVAPAVQNNSTGWGPCEMPEQFRDIPYQPFSKGDRLGKVCRHALSHIFSTR